MTNTIDVFLPEYPHMALPATTTMVFIDGVLCDDLELIEIVRGSWPDFGSAKFVYNPAAWSDRDSGPSIDLEHRFAMGRTVCVRQLHNGTPPGNATFDVPLFTGQIETCRTVMGSDDQTFEITASDFSPVMRRITVYGRHVFGADGSTYFLSGLDTTFNPLGAGNAATSSVAIEGKTYIPFSSGDSDATSWTFASVINYLLSHYLPSGSLHWPDIDSLRTLTEDRLAVDLDVTGLSLLEALHRCCQHVGLAFRFEPRMVETGPAQAIVFYRNGEGRSIELNCQPKGQLLSVSRTNVMAQQSHRDFSPITHRYIGQGDFKVYESTFELVKAWDSDLEDTSYAKFSAATNPEFYAVKDVYRKWCLNEAGDYTPEPYNQGEPFDFTSLFEGADFLRRRRRFRPTLNTDTQGQSFGYFLEVSYDGVNWWQYLHAFNILTEQCGIWLSSDALDFTTWIAALKGLLRFRITASVVSDQRLTCIVADGPVGSTVPVVDHVMTLPRQFKYAKVSSDSVLAQIDPAMLGTSTEADDTNALYEYVRWQAQVSRPIIEKTEIQTPTLSLHFHPGDRVTSSPDSRDLFSLARDNRSRVWVQRVVMNFRTQQTQLKLARQRSG